jgi:small-conductance mechanosensitive channel
MDSANGATAGIFDGMASAASLGQLVVVVIVGLLAVTLGHYVKAWHYRHEASIKQPAWQANLLECVALLSPHFTALLGLLVARSIMASLAARTGIIDTAVYLAAALIAVRLGVFLLGVLLGPQSWLRGWQGRLTLLIWLIVGFRLLGWFDRVETTLDAIDLLPGKATFSLWSLLKGIVVVTGFVVATSVIARAIERRVMTLDSVAMSTRIGISKFAHFFLVGLGILLGVNAAGVDLTALTVLTGAIGLGLGFGLQAIASNFVSGFVLLLDKSIKPGDVISFTGHTGTSTENFGWVQELRGRYVVVRDRDGVETLVPNQNLITNSVINWSYSDQRVRLRLPVMISYQDDPEVALQLLIDAAADHPRILQDPAPVSRLLAFEDYGMKLEARFWIRDPMNGVNNVRSDINRVIFRMFRRHGITIPVAQREIRIVGAAAPEALRGLQTQRKPEPPVG